MLVVRKGRADGDYCGGGSLVLILVALCAGLWRVVVEIWGS